VASFEIVSRLIGKERLRATCPQTYSSFVH
jgi:hypothetical protein